MKSIVTISDPEALQLMADDTRRKIIHMLRAKEMTVSQLADELDLTPQAVYHHIKKMLKAGLVEVSREERVEHLIESYYRAVAEAFLFHMGEASFAPKYVSEELQAAINGLRQIGFDIEEDPEKISRLVELETKLAKCCLSGKYEEAITRLENVGFLTKQAMLELVRQLSPSDEEYEEFLRLKREHRDALKSLVKRSP
ncbi:MAG: metalloregulator ArsR/SmtB family transcription factor [Candidatus Verstraetearchaeota archaeon]|nr:metalloregulator ArsR/SmtB family transcription factor [Candidatus Verstraetearchaeota archaeon]